MSGPQSTFLLIHGAWHGGWCWSRVAARLRSRGHRVLTPTLTGLGERSHLTAPGGINCSTHVEDILNVIRWEDLDDIVLCGHSYGGIVTGAVADRVPQRIRSVVFLDTIVPDDGKSFLDQIGTPEHVAFLVAQAGENAGMMLPPFTAESFAVGEGDRAWVDAKCTPQAFATFAERMRINGAYEGIARKIHVRAAGWDGSPFGAHHERAKALAGWTTAELSCGHDAMIDDPEMVALLLEEAAG